MAETRPAVPAGPSTRSQRGLDWLNFFIADVETAFGPFIAVYLSAHGWRQGEIGSILTVNSAVALATAGARRRAGGLDPPQAPACWPPASC